MVTPLNFLDLADEEAYQQARERLICHYCDYKYPNSRSLNEPIEVYSSNRSVKRWVVVCRRCARAIVAYNRKMNRQNKVQTRSHFYYEDEDSKWDYEEDGGEEVHHPDAW